MFIKETEKIFFAEHLSLMLKGGITINEALAGLEKSAKSRAFRKVIKGLLQSILKGENFSSSLAKYPRIFNKFFCSIVGVGEESGTLQENLKHLAGQIRLFYQMKKRVRGALIYPIIVILMAIGIAGAVSFLILPRMLNLFNFLDVPPPLTTRILINVSSFSREYWWAVLGVVILLGFAVKILSRLKLFKMLFDKVRLGMPFFGAIFCQLNLARISRSFYTLLKSGVPILKAVQIVSEMIPNSVYRKRLILVKPAIEKGEKMSQALKAFPKLFPSAFLQMLAVGEKSGSLEESFAYLADFYEKEVDSVLKNLSSILEPFLLILVGLFVAFIAIAVIIPIYHFIGQFRISAAP